MPGEDAPEINASFFLQAPFTASLAGLMGTLEDPELAAEITNSPRARGVITAREAGRGGVYPFLELLFFSQGLGRSSACLKHKPLIELVEQIVPASTIHFGGLFLTLSAAPPLGFGVEEAFTSRNGSSALGQLTWSSAECCL